MLRIIAALFLVAMSLGIVVNTPEGIVLAAESRVTLTARNAVGAAMQVHFDNATKLLSFREPNDGIGAVTYGNGAIGLRTAQSFVPEFEASLPDDRLSVEVFAERLRAFYKARWDESGVPATNPMHFLVVGYNDGAPYGETYEVIVPQVDAPHVHHNQGDFGIIWGGQREVVDRIVKGYDGRVLDAVTAFSGLDAAQRAALEQLLVQFELPVPIASMSLQDVVDFAILMLRTTIETQRLTVGLRGTGGHIDVATITREDRLRFVQRKTIRGERASHNA